MPKLFDRVKVNIATTGTGAVTFGPASSPAFLTAAQAGAVDGDTVRYTIVDGTDFEEGVGTIFSSVAQMARTTVTRSKIGGVVDANKIDLSGTAVLVFTVSAADILNPANNLSEIASASAARANLGLGSAATAPASAFLQPGNNLSDVSNPATARNNIGAAQAFPSGTRMLFQQTSAPTGWTKDTTHNDKALRVVSGTASSGGSSAFSTVFGKTQTDVFTLTATYIPNHYHRSVRTLDGQALQSGAGSPYELMAEGGSASGDVATDAVGGGSAHAHGLDLRVQYVDLIIATKD